MRQCDVEGLIRSLDFSKLEKIDIDALLNEPILNLSQAEKLLYRAFYDGELSDKEISEKNGIAFSSVAWNRWNFHEKSREALLFLLLSSEMLRGGMPPKRANKRSFGLGDYFPVIQKANMTVSDFIKDKHALHSNDACRRHLTSIVLLAHCESNELCFFVTKNNGLYDTCGEHTRRKDLIAAEDGGTPDIGSRIDLEKTLMSTCIRGAKEEIVIRGIKRAEYSVDDFEQLWIDRSDTINGQTANSETSGVFLFKKKDIADVKFKDEVRSTVIEDASLRVESVAKAIPLKTLISEYNENPGSFSDGLARCIKHLSENNDAAERIKELLI